MFCEKCGKKINDDEMFCEGCGTPVKRENKAPTPVPPMNQRGGQVPPMNQGRGPVPPMNQGRGPVPPMNQGRGPVPPMNQGRGPVPPMNQGRGPVPPMYGNQPMQMAPKKPMNKMKRNAIVEAIVLVVCLFFVFNMASEKMSSKAVAQQYFNAMLSGDYSTMYGMLDLPESELLTEEMFITVKSREYVGEIDIDEMEIISDSSNEKGDCVSYQCAYEEDGDTKVERILVNKEKGKKWFFFDKWSVVLPTQLQEPITIETFPEATVTIDGVDLGSVGGDVEVIENTTGAEYDDLAYSTTYVMDALFDGLHNIVITYDDMEIYNETEYLEDGMYRTITNVSTSDDLKTEVASNTVKFLEEMYQSSVDGDTLEAFEDKLSVPVAKGFVADNVYANYGYVSGNTVIDSVQIDSFQFHTDSLVYDVELGGFMLWQGFEAVMLQEGHSISAYGNREYSDDWYMDGAAVYLYQDGEWKLQNIYY